MISIEWWDEALKFMHDHSANVFFKGDSVVFEWHSGKYVYLLENTTLFEAVKEAIETEEKMIDGEIVENDD